MYKDYSIEGTPLVVQGVLSSGLGTNGIFTTVEMVPNSSDGGFGDIAVGPQGEVMVGFQDNIFSAGLADIFISVNTNEIVTNGLGTNDFPIRGPGCLRCRLAVLRIVPQRNWHHDRRHWRNLNAALSLGWDSDAFSQNFDRAYLTYTEQSTNGNLDIDFCYSTNQGAVWSAESTVNDDTGTSDHFLPRMAVDPVTGIIAHFVAGLPQ